MIGGVVKVVINCSSYTNKLQASLLGTALENLKFIPESSIDIKIRYFASPISLSSSQCPDVITTTRSTTHISWLRT